MKFLDLRLLAYGPFRDVKLAFEPDPLGLHVIYGPNEAGKSTALRAVKGLLYGIADAKDAHLHRTTDLRIGARLGDEHGATLDVVRRKGVKNTLLDPADEHPIDEALLKRLLGGVGEEHFATMFGIDHEGLRRGAQALLAGRGHVGESLFEAGLGGVGLHEVLGQLKAEAESLFTPNARNRPLNDALKKFADAQKRSREGALSSETWLKQKEAIDEASEERARLEREARELTSRKARLARTKKTLPLVARRRAVASERAELGAVVVLAETAAAERRDAQRVEDEARRRIERLGEELRALEERRTQLRIPESLVAEQARMKSVQDRYGGYVDAGRDLPRVRGELRRADDEIAALAQNLGRAGEAEARIDAALQARVKKLALEAQNVAAARERALRAVDEARAELDAARAAVEALSRPVDASPLRTAIEAARRHGDVDALEARLTEELARVRTAAERRQLQLAPWSGPLEAVPSLPVPSLETVATHEQALAAIERAEHALEVERSKLAERREQIATGLDVLRREGAPPTEEDLAAARTARTRAWAPIKRGGAAAAELEAYEAEVAAADAVADRLRREALKVARQAQLLADEASAARDAERLERDGAQLAARRRTAEEAWVASWAAAGITPASPSEMRGWLQRHAQLATQVEQLETLARELDAQTAVRDRLAAELARALRSAGGDAPDELLARRLDRAAALAQELEAQAVERREAEAAIARAGRELDARVREQTGREESWQAWRAAWSAVTGALGLGGDASPEEATAVLELHAELQRARERRRELVRRVDGMERDMSQYAGDVAALAAAHAPELAALPVEQAASQLVALYQKGRSDLQRREEIDGQREEKRQALAAERDRLEQAGLRLGELMRAARVDDLTALEAAEQRSQKAHALDARLREAEEQLHGLSDGATLAQLEAEAQAHAADDLDAELERVEEELARVQGDKDAVVHRIGGYEEALKEWDRGSTAADAAAEAQEHLSRARGFVDRWLRVKLSQAVLARQIEQYRERNQGPILTRSSELFRRLTLDAYAGLRSSFDDHDQPVLVCLRKDGREVPVEGLSDGTRDQLYLALRLATLERHASAHEPMPLVVDDILIHFDDHRAQASLAVLGELSQRMQVLFFTHHARLLELARQAVPPAQLKEHRLP